MNDALIGRQVAQYRVERLLGRGGMASVYFAWDTAGDRPVALKVLDERYSDVQSSIDRFVHEAQTIAQWDHPHIVHVYDAGESGGIYYYAMEFIRGLDLAQLLRQYQEAGQLLPFEEVIRFGRAVASALDFAHAHGIIHRDVKPSNVLVSVDGRILLSDFGLVMDVARGTLGETFGSPHYIAPEQARRSSEAVPQSDIYSLGVMLYEMLTGVVPFHDPSPAALALKHLTEDPPAPRSLNPRLSPAVEAVLLRALRKLPQERYQSGRELMPALERALAPELQRDDASEPMPASAQTQRARSLVAQDLDPGGAAVPPVVPPGGELGALRPNQGRDPASTAVMDAAPRTGYSGRPPGANTGGYAQSPSRAGGAAVPPMLPPSHSRPAGGFGRGLGCLALLLVTTVGAVVLGAALAFRGSGGFAFPGPALPTATGEPSPTPPPTLTPTSVPSLTPTGTLAPTLTFTPEPTLTETPVPTDLPTPTPVPPTETVEPTTVPGPDLLIAKAGNDGFVMVNQGSAPVTLALLEIWDRELAIAGEEWALETLLPGQCVYAWERGTDPRLPGDIACEAVGEVITRPDRERVWTRSMEIRYQGEPVADCPRNRERCEIELP